MKLSFCTFHLFLLTSSSCEWVVPWHCWVAPLSPQSHRRSRSPSRWSAPNPQTHQSLQQHNQHVIVLFTESRTVYPLKKQKTFKSLGGGQNRIVIETETSRNDGWCVINKHLYCWVCLTRKGSIYYLPLWMILAERSMTSDRLNWSWSALSGRKESSSGPPCSSSPSPFTSAGLSACSLPFRPTATDKDQTLCLMSSFRSGLQRCRRSLFNQRWLSPSRSQCSRQAAWSLLVRKRPSEPLTFSDCEQWLWRPRHVINHQVERLEVVEERGRLLIHGHGVDDLQSQWKLELITGRLITNPCSSGQAACCSETHLSF